MANSKMAAVTPQTEVARQSTVIRQSKSKRFDSAWSQERRRAVEEYISSMQVTLRLQDWTLSVDWSAPCEKGALATITPMEDSRHACVRMSAEFLSLKPVEQTQTLVHEMVHCYLFEIDSLATASVEEATSKKAARMYAVAHNGCIERTVDTIADALSVLVPQLDLP